MKTWTPLVIAVVLAGVMNAFPLFMALVVHAEGWLEAGWVFYLITIPVALVLLLWGVVTSLVRYSRREAN